MTSPSDTSTPDQSPNIDTREGLLTGIFCYLLWGFLPVLFYIAREVGALTIVADRTLWALVFVAIVISVTKRWDEVAAALRDPATMRNMAISALLLATNWLVYVWSVETNQLLEASFGYFIIPLLNVAIGMLALRERQNRWQWLAIAIAAVAITLQAVGIGRFPWVALTLALSFGFYGLFRKTTKVGSTSGLFVETLLLAPLAAGFLIYTFIRDGSFGYHADPMHLGLLMLLGPGTALPLLLFGYAVQRLRLTTAGVLQYIAPIIGFILAIFAFGEEINVSRVISFVLICISLAVYTADSLARRPRNTA